MISSYVTGIWVHLAISMMVLAMVLNILMMAITIGSQSVGNSQFSFIYLCGGRPCNLCIQNSEPGTALIIVDPEGCLNHDGGVHPLTISSQRIHVELRDESRGSCESRAPNSAPNIAFPFVLWYCRSSPPNSQGKGKHVQCWIWTHKNAPCL